MKYIISKRARRLQHLRLKAMKECADELEDDRLYLFFCDLVDSHHHLQAEIDDLRSRAKHWHEEGNNCPNHADKK